MNEYVISPSLLHKGSSDDVLIGAPKLAMPWLIGVDEVPSLPSSPLCLAYRPAAAGGLEFFPMDAAGQGGNWPAGSLAADAQWRTVRAVPYQLLDQHGLQADVCAAVGALYEALPGRRQAGSYQFINQADHYFFYRKAHEHVPGTMLIEAARQAVYHHFYTQTRHVRGEVTVSLNDLNSSFYAYAELMYPIELVVDDLDWSNTALPIKIHYRVSFYQRGFLLAVIDTKASILNLKRFERVRNLFIFADDWYRPIKPAQAGCWLIAESGEEEGVLLCGVSKQECLTAPPVTLSNPQAIRIAGYGFEFSARIRAQDKGRLIRWRFEDVPPLQLQVLNEMVKRGFVHLSAEELNALQQGSACEQVHRCESAA